MYKKSLDLHKKMKGKISITSKQKINDTKELSLVYSPGVAAPCLEIEKNPEKSYVYTARNNLVGVITDGSAVLGMGDIGPLASIPVMEGKAMLFKEFADIDALPLAIKEKNVNDFVKIVQSMEVNFGGINLEDISAPRCFKIEEQLKKKLSIPVFHDDQHGTAIVVLAALMNSLKLVEKKLSEIKVVVNGPGAAGTAIINLLIQFGVRNIIVCDEQGILSEQTVSSSEPHKLELLKRTNPEHTIGNLSEAMVSSDVFIGVSIGNVLTEEMIHSMNTEPIIFALANPEPEIDYQLGKKYGAFIIGTGRSDSPNQINNVLAFPGVFKGALSVRAKEINEEMKIAAAEAIAQLISEKELNSEYIIPSAFDRRVVEVVSKAVAQKAIQTKVAKIR